MTELVKYDAMCHAITECHRIDEVKDIRDKAMALALYAKQIKNTDAERKACAIRVRAEIRTGELLKDLARGNPGKPRRDSPDDSPSPYASTLAENGISDRDARRYQTLASVDPVLIEEVLRDPVLKPSTARIIDSIRDPQLKMPSDSLWFWGRLRDFERDDYFTKNIVDLMEPMTDSMRADVLRILPLMADFFNEAKEVAHEFA